MATVPVPEVLLDHRGNPKPLVQSTLDYEQAGLGSVFHEAGHAVLSMAYGLHVVSSEVIAWFPEAGGYGMTGNTAVQCSNVSPWHFAAQAAAGEVAKVQYLMAYGLWTPENAAACAADHDREQAIDVLTDFGYRLDRDHVPEGGKSWGMGRGMARSKISHLWREIRPVAHAMNEQTKLTGDEIAASNGLVNAPLDGGAA
ncbi:UNVERIFIED_CONTAM: hypothetical protein RKD43_001356 [Streptomyces graminofaciens]